MNFRISEKNVGHILSHLDGGEEGYYSQAANKLPGEPGSRFIVPGVKVPLAVPVGEYRLEGDNIKQISEFTGYRVIPPDLYERFSELCRAKNPRRAAVSFVERYGLLGLGPLFECSRQMGLKHKIHRRPWAPDFPPEKISTILEESKRLAVIIDLYGILQEFYREHGVLLENTKNKTLRLLREYESIPFLSDNRMGYPAVLPPENEESLVGEELVKIIKGIIQQAVNWYLGDLQLKMYFPEEGLSPETRILNAGLIKKMYLQFLQDITAGVRFMECPVCRGAMAARRGDKRFHTACGEAVREKRLMLKRLIQAVSSLKGDKVSLVGLREEYLKLWKGKSWSLKKIERDLLGLGIESEDGVLKQPWKEIILSLQKELKNLPSADD